MNSIRAKKTGELRSTVAVDKKHGEALDNPLKLDRPFFRSSVEKFRPKFKENIKKAIGGK